MINGDGRELHILLTHLHLDHLQGLGFFRPLFDPDLDVHLWGPASPVQRLAERIAIYLSPPLFPVRLADIPARLVFHDEPHHIAIGSATVHAANVTHQGPTVGYRIEEHGRVLAYVPDHEPSIGGDLDHQPAGLDQRPRRRARRRRPVPRRAVRRPASTRRMSGGATRASTTCYEFARKARRRTSSCCSITTRTTPTTSSRRCSTTRGGGGTDAGDRVCLAHEGMTVTLDAAGTTFAASQL